jgi:hypothetical protein
MINRVVHDNGVIDTQANDPNGIPRPQSITFGDFGSCVAPSITTPPPATSYITSGGQATLMIGASGSDLRYQWYEGVVALSGANTQVFVTDHLTTDHWYNVVVMNSCGSRRLSTDVRVSIGVAPTISVQPQSMTFSPPSVRLTVSLNTGVFPAPAYQWYQGTGPSDPARIQVGNQPDFDVVNLAVTTSYFVHVYNAVGTADSTVATVTVSPPLSAPTYLWATMQTPTSVALSWTGSPGANHYEIWRRENAGILHYVGPSFTTGYSDTSAAPNTAYLYQVCASPAQGTSCTSAFSNQDLATTVAFTDIVNDATIRLVVFTELLTAVNAVRAANGWSSVNWADILASSPVPAVNGIVYGEYIMVLRLKMDDALSHLLGIQPPGYTDPTLPGSPKVIIKAIHINELRGRVQ